MPPMMGLVLSGFFWTYAFMQMPFGWFADRVGARISLAVAVGVVVGVHRAHGRGARRRHADGLPAAARRRRGRRLSLDGQGGRQLVSAQRAGHRQPASSTAARASARPFRCRWSTWLIASFSWETSFVVTGLLGIIWAVFWVIFYRDPEQHRSVTPEQLRDCRRNGARSKRPGRKSLGRRCSATGRSGA